MLSALIAVWSCLIDGPEPLPERRELLLLLGTREPRTAQDCSMDGLWFRDLGLFLLCFALVTIRKVQGGGADCKTTASGQ